VEVSEYRNGERNQSTTQSRTGRIAGATARCFLIPFAFGGLGVGGDGLGVLVLLSSPRCNNSASSVFGLMNDEGLELGCSGESLEGGPL